MEFINYDVKKDLIIAGGGFPAICAAIQAARHGLSVALINNRGYIGGNASAELFISVCGVMGTQEFNFHMRESALVEEILLENLHRNPNGNRYIWDGVLMDFILKEKNIELFLNTHIDSVKTENGNIICVSGIQQTTEKKFSFYGENFMDATGDGTVGYLAGADFRMGREASSEFGEKIAPAERDDYVLPSTLMFVAHDTGSPVKYTAPHFALDLTKTDILKHRMIPKEYFNISQWFYEIGGDLCQIKDNEEIIKKHRELVYGIWDYIKNSGEYPSENYELIYVSCIPGKRESRRLVGDYILKEQDITNQTEFDDAVGYGGWSIDLHALKGIFDTDIINRHIYLNGVYQIPYRCGYSRNINNLFLAGRCMSTSHVAFGSVRVIATLSTLAQALGTAAYLCKKYNTTPRGVYKELIKELQLLIQRNDQYIIGKALNDPNDLAKLAKIEVSSVKEPELTDMTGFFKAEVDTAIIIPVMKKAGSLYLKVKALCNTVLNYNIYTPDKPQNYGPQSFIGKNSVSVNASDNFVWIELPLNLTVSNTKVFVEISANEDLELALAGRSLTGINCLKKVKEGSEQHVDVNTLKAKEYMWNWMENGFCFKLSEPEDIYGGHNIINGFHRPEALPNLWMSDCNTENEFIKLSFNEIKQIKEMCLTFDSNLNIWLLNSRKYEFNAMPAVVKDYTVYYKENGEYNLLVDIKNNYQRTNKLNFKPIATDELKIVFNSTNGSDSIELYSICLY